MSIQIQSNNGYQKNLKHHHKFKNREKLQQQLILLHQHLHLVHHHHYHHHQYQWFHHRKTIFQRQQQKFYHQQILVKKNKIYHHLLVIFNYFIWMFIWFMITSAIYDKIFSLFLFSFNYYIFDGIFITKNINNNSKISEQSKSNIKEFSFSFEKDLFFILVSRISRSTSFIAWINWWSQSKCN